MENENKNPTLVLDAIIDAPSTFGDVTIGDVTILKYAYLEKLQSPFIDATQQFTVGSIVPSVFVLSQPKEILRQYGNDMERLREDALEWADDHLKVDDFPKIIDAMSSKFLALNKAAPTSVGEEKKIGEGK